MKDNLDALINHPFTSIQLSDKEKFHTGMLKVMLDTIGKPAYKCVFGTKFTEDLFRDNASPSIILEQDSIDMVIKKSFKNDKTESIFAIIESKFKTGLHYSKVKGEYRSQLTKYAYSKTGLKAEYGFVISLFKENEEDLKTEDIHKQNESKIDKFEPLQFVDFDFNLLQKEITCFNLLNSGKSEILDQVVLIGMWLNYLNYLCEVVKPFVKKRLKDVSYDNFENNLKKLKLKGVFERYRLKLIEKELKKIIKNKTDLKNSLKNGASFENIPNIDNNFIIIRNTNGNESLELVINTEEGNKNFCYGIEWQTGSVRVFIKWNKTNKIGEELKSKREECLMLFISKIEPHLENNDIINEVIEKYNKEGKLSHRDSIFKSVTVIKKNVFQDIEDMSKTLFDIICVIYNNGVHVNNILKS